MSEATKMSAHGGERELIWGVLCNSKDLNAKALLATTSIDAALIYKPDP
jgi:hypothetical protein